jgi:predicted acylesterase/phospholipase RssA
LLAVALIAAGAGCSSLPRNPVPVEFMDAATIAGMPGIRAWADTYDEAFQENLVQSVRDERPSDFCTAGNGCDFATLALSGGGAHGAFGSGYLNGWTVTGSRPVFKLVTGISTGALIAPFAFLGAEYDDELEHLFTFVSKKEIYKRRNVFGLINAESLAKTTPLAELIQQNVDEKIIRRVAQAHREGRRLLVGTTNLDAQRLVIWNMGAIATIGTPAAMQLFRDVLLASSSIPVAFPPVYIEVNADGSRYDEMHVDGGVMTMFFLFEHLVDIRAARQQLGLDTSNRRSTVYVIRNGQMGSPPAPVRRRIPAIAQRSLDALLASVAMGDLFRIWVETEQAGFGFRYAAIPEDHEPGSPANFDPATMRELYELGYDMALGERPWHVKPPWIDQD